ncbi:MAG: hypothetical protein ACRCYZ_02315 [Alphaproteobacteria bacterium]
MNRRTTTPDTGIERKRDVNHTICIGSAGFTTNVQDNSNLENVVLLFNQEAAYAKFLEHFQDIQHGQKGLTLQKL